MILDDKGLPEMMMVLHHNWDKGEVMISLLKCKGWIVVVWDGLNPNIPNSVL